MQSALTNCPQIDRTKSKDVSLPKSHLVTSRLASVLLDAMRGSKHRAFDSRASSRCPSISARDVLRLLAWIGMPIVARRPTLVRDVGLVALLFVALVVFDNRSLLVPLWLLDIV